MMKGEKMTARKLQKYLNEAKGISVRVKKSSDNYIIVSTKPLSEKDLKVIRGGLTLFLKSNNVSKYQWSDDKKALVFYNNETRDDEYVNLTNLIIDEVN